MVSKHKDSGGSSQILAWFSSWKGRWMTLGWFPQGKALGIWILSVLSELRNSLSHVEAGLGLILRHWNGVNSLWSLEFHPFLGRQVESIKTDKPWDHSSPRSCCCSGMLQGIGLDGCR